TPPTRRRPPPRALPRARGGAPPPVEIEGRRVGGVALEALRPPSQPAGPVHETVEDAGEDARDGQHTARSEQLLDDGDGQCEDNDRDEDGEGHATWGGAHSLGRDGHGRAAAGRVRRQTSALTPPPPHASR